MKILNKIKNWWKNNQEKNSERYIERQEFMKELDEYSKDIIAMSKSPIVNINENTLKRAVLVQTLHSQKNLNKSTDSLKLATWFLAFATAIFAWVTIIDSSNSNYFIQNLKGIATILGGIFIILLAGTLIWNCIKFVFNWIKRILNKKKQ